MNKGIVAGGLLIAAVAAVGGATAMSGRRVAGEIDALLKTDPAKSGVQVAELERQKSFGGTKGALRFAMHGACGRALPTKADIGAVLRYDVTHVPGAAGLVRVQGTLAGDGDLGEGMKQALGSAQIARFDGEMRYDGKWVLRWQTPPMNFGSDRVSVRAEASSGEMTIARGGGLEMQWKLPSLAVRGEGKALAIRDLRAEARLHDAELGLGASRMSIAAVESDAGTVQGVEVVSESGERDGLIYSLVRPSVARIAFGGDEWKDLGFELAFTDLDAASVRSLQRLVSETCAMQQATARERREFMQAVGAIERRGAALRLSRLRGSGNRGSVDGGVELRLNPGGDAGRTFADRVSAQGRLAVSEALVPRPQLRQLLGGGMVVREGDKVVASFDLAGGRLQVNGRPDQSGVAESIGVALAAADAKWHELLATAAEAPVSGRMRPSVASSR